MRGTRNYSVSGPWILFVAGLFSCMEAFAASARELTEMAKQRAAEAAERAAAVKPGQAVDQKRIEDLARQGRERGRAEFERRAAAERQRHQAAVNAAREKGEIPKEKKEGERPPVSGRLVVAISSSMPDEMVREYMRQLDRVPEAIVVLRGFVGGAKKVAPTGVWIERVRRQRADCRECAHYLVEVVVDPLAYEMLGIAKVPAVTFLPGVQDLRHCDADALESTSVAYGATSVSAALKAIQAKNVQVPEELIRRLGGRP
jgi:hypothetical protein